MLASAPSRGLILEKNVQKILKKVFDLIFQSSSIAQSLRSLVKKDSPASHTLIDASVLLKKSFYEEEVI